MTIVATHKNGQRLKVVIDQDQGKLQVLCLSRMAQDQISTPSKPNPQSNANVSKAISGAKRLSSLDYASSQALPHESRVQYQVLKDSEKQDIIEIILYSSSVCKDANLSVISQLDATQSVGETSPMPSNIFHLKSGVTEKEAGYDIRNMILVEQPSEEKEVLGSSRQSEMNAGHLVMPDQKLALLDSKNKKSSAQFGSQLENTGEFQFGSSENFTLGKSKQSEYEETSNEVDFNQSYRRQYSFMKNDDELSENDKLQKLEEIRSEDELDY